MKILKTHDELVNNVGRKVTCEIDGTKIEDAKIQFEYGIVFICQNKKDGTGTDNKLGYKYTWAISRKGLKYEEDNRNCTNITLVEEESEVIGNSEQVEPQYKTGDWVEVSDNGEEWVKRMYLMTHKSLVVCVSQGYENEENYKVLTWKYIRPIKQKTKLTLKQIAEKFGVEENNIEII